MPGRGRGGGGPVQKIIGRFGKVVAGTADVTLEYKVHREERKASSANANPAGAPGNSSGHAWTADSQSQYGPGYWSQGPDDQVGQPAEQRRYPDVDADLEFGSYQPGQVIDNDEEAWWLDELAEPMSPPRYEAVPCVNDTAGFMVTGPQSWRAPLSLPVIIPQRRPHAKSRGFVRAYAPVLEDIGVSQATFLNFLTEFDEASKANPTWNVILIAATVGGFVPEVITQCVTTAVQFGAAAGKEADTRRKTNNFLDLMNEQLFKPAGCYAMIVKYKSDVELAQGPLKVAGIRVSSTPVDISSTTAIAKYDGTSGLKNTFRLNSGATIGTLALPECAPLIYPELDAVLYTGADGKESFKDKTKDAKDFLTNYADRRARAAYAKDDPDSALRIPESEKKMHTKWADPNHPMFTNGLIGLMSAGKVGKPSINSTMQSSRGGRGSDGRGGGRPKLISQGGEKVMPIGTIRKLMREDVLYLMIVAMPSESELRAAR